MALITEKQRDSYEIGNLLAVHFELTPQMLAAQFSNSNSKWRNSVAHALVRLGPSEYWGSNQISILAKLTAPDGTDATRYAVNPPETWRLERASSRMRTGRV
jgi:hypothetical protein